MPLQKLLFKPGVNRENTRYSTEGGWYDCEKVRFRQGSPEKIGGWARISATYFLGICRSLWNWITLGGENLMGVGTHLKFYIENGGAYNDVTPIRTAMAVTSFAASNGSAVITVTAAGHGVSVGDYVTFYGAASLGGNITAAVLNREYVVATSATTFTFVAAATANSSDTGNGGALSSMAAQIRPGEALAVPAIGWGTGGWSSGVWGTSTSSTTTLRLWSQWNYGEDLIFGYRGGPLYYWNASYSLAGSTVTITIASPGVVTSTITVANGEALALSTTGNLPTGLLPGKVYYVVNTSGTTFQLSLTSGGAAINTSGTQAGTHTIMSRGIAISLLGFANEVPLQQNTFLVSDVSRFVIAFGTNDALGSINEPLLIRWSDQEDPQVWMPAVTNQAGSIQLSHGSEIVGVSQTSREILVITDQAVYSLQYVGPPYVWSATMVGDDISIASQNVVITNVSGTYWMGHDKFYRYDGSTRPLKCDVLKYIFTNINHDQEAQFFAGTNEGFDEIWWFYCSANSTTIDRYVVYNYVEQAWTYGSMARTAWIDSGLRDYPIAATYSNNLVQHESGLDDNVTGTPVAIEASITSSEFDIGDGHNFGFVWRLVPDVTFTGSTATSPQVTFSLNALKNAGSGYNSPMSVAGESSATVTRTATVPVEAFTGQVYVRLRGRQMSLGIASDALGIAWQLGAPRIDIRPDGRAG